MLHYDGISAFVILLIAALTDATEPQRFRTDYGYNSHTNAYYKLHIEPVNNYEAKRICEAEGGKLVVPSNQWDILQLHQMLKQYPDLQLVWAGDDGEQHESAEEIPLIDIKSEESHDDAKCEVFSRSALVEKTSCYLKHPFACKVNAKDVYYDSQCKVAGIGYQYEQSTRSCYKVPLIAYNWNSAFEDCNAQGAHLVVINSETEANVVKGIINPVHKKGLIRGVPVSYFFYAGFRAEREINGTARVFKTIFNETLSQAGYGVWSEGEPNNAKGEEYCGSIFINGKLNDVNCVEKFGYVCEAEVKGN